jgi:hypothetical protein
MEQKQSREDDSKRWRRTTTIERSEEKEGKNEIDTSFVVSKSFQEQVHTDNTDDLNS